MDDEGINRLSGAQQANASCEMAGVTSLPVRVKFWRGARLSGPAIMVCTNVLVSQSKHSKSCYLLSFSLLLSNSAPFFFLLMVRAKRSCQEKKGSSSKWKSGNRDQGEGRGREGGERLWRRRETGRQMHENVQT